MSQADKVAADRELLRSAKSKGLFSTLGVYFRLSGPGWLQSAITLGGGSLGSSLYLGVLVGFGMLWLQPFAMLLGIIMLSAIGYVTMSTGKRPLRAINEHVNPVLGWSWVIATLAANMVWCLPQYSLASAVLQQNLLPDVLGPSSSLGDFNGKVAIAAVILILCTAITWSYGSGSRGIKIYETMLKIMVGIIVLCFVGVVVRLSFSSEPLAWASVWNGFVPDLSLLNEPAQGFKDMLGSPKITEAHREFWNAKIVGQQHDRMIAAAATAVGINMTFLFPYSILKKGWTREFRGLSIFDLFTGMLIPFVLATSCVIIASASQFHTVPVKGFLGEKDADSKPIVPAERLQNEYQKIMKERVRHELGETRYKDLGQDALQDHVDGIPAEEKRVAASLLQRDANDLAKSLKPLTGGGFANVIFGVGVLGMTLSTISLLMLISGFVVCETFNVPPTGWAFRIGTLLAASGALGPFIWSGDARFYLTIPTSVFGACLLPLAYLTFFLLMNQKRLLGDDMPRGLRRLIVNLGMALAAGVALLASLWAVHANVGYWGLVGAVLLLFLAVAIPPRTLPKKDDDATQLVDD